MSACKIFALNVGTELVADDGKILSYDIEVDGRETTRHRKYLSKIPNSNVETEDENIAGADQATE